MAKVTTGYTFGCDRHQVRAAQLLADGKSYADIILVLWGVSLWQNKGSVRETMSKWNVVVRWAVWFILLFAILLFGMYGPGFEASAFTYGKY